MQPNRYAINAYHSAQLTTPPLTAVVMLYDGIMVRIAAAGEAAQTLDERLKRARLHIDELSVLTASGERIAQRMESAAASPRVAREIPDMPLPSTSILSRLERAVQ